MNVQNIDRLFDTLDKCRKSIYYACSNGDVIDIKSIHFVRDMLKEACRKHGIEQFSVSVEDMKDKELLLNYLISYY